MILTEAMGNAPYLWNPIFNRGIVKHPTVLQKHMTPDDTSTTDVWQCACDDQPILWHADDCVPVGVIL